MGRPAQTPIWPFLLVVAFLFLLCLAAPREWSGIAHYGTSRASRVVATTQTPSDIYSEATPRAPLSWPAEAADVLDFDAVAPVAEATVVETDDAAAEPSGDEALAAESSTAPTTEFIAPEPAPAALLVARQSPIVEPHPEIAEPTIAAEPKPDAKSSAGAPDEPRATVVETAAPLHDEAPATIVVADSAGGWIMPADLLRRLENLACECECTDWACDVTDKILLLCEQTAPTDPHASRILAELRSAAAQVDALVPTINNRAIAIELLRVRHGLIRRLDVWELMPGMFTKRTQPARPDAESVQRLAATLDEIETITRAAGTEGDQWRRYLALATLRALTNAQSGISTTDAQRLAVEIRQRISRRDLSDAQRRFTTSKPVVALSAALRPWTLDGLDPARLLADVERFEATTQPSDAHNVADDYLEAALISTRDGDLAQRLETNYRNANIRFALSEKLLKRLLPAVSTSTDPVRDQVLGIPTRGVSTTSTKVDVKLVPDGRRLRVALEASGQVLANTQSTSGPATLYTHSDSSYLARKVVDLDLRGIRTWPAESECIDARTRLRSVSTDFDGVPLVGALVETVARSRHAEQESEVRSVLRRKVESQARRKMDSVAEERLDKVNQLMRERVIQPLEAMSLDPQVISAETSEERLTMRIRLASEDQLAGHTPRPRAPGDSLMSLQIHQSVFNNICEQLDLCGRTFTLTQLRAHIIKTLNLQNSQFMDATDKEVTITFADSNAVCVHCEDGRIGLNLAVAKLSNEERTWKNFQVRVFYRPEVAGLQASLVRDGTVQLIGSRLGAQIPLRGIFSKAFAKDRNLLLVDPKWSQDERTRDLLFSQFVIQDGWIAVAVAEPRNNVARQPQLTAPR